TEASITRAVEIISVLQLVAALVSFYLYLLTLFCSGVIRSYRIPVYHIKNGLQVCRAFVLIFEIISMLPNIDTEYRSSFDLCYIHQWIILIWRRSYGQFTVCTDAQP